MSSKLQKQIVSWQRSAQQRRFFLYAQQAGWRENALGQGFTLPEVTVLPVRITKGNGEVTEGEMQINNGKERN